MRVTAQTVFIAVFCVLAFIFFQVPAYAQTANSSYSTNVPTSNDFLFPNTASNVPQNHHTFTQVELIDVLSAAMCQLTGIDPTNPSQPCLGIDPTTGKIGFASTNPQQFGEASHSQPQIGGALAFMSQNISSLYVPAVSATQYGSYLSANFGIAKPVYAAGDCNTNPFGYGFCGLSPIIKLWSDVRDLAYALLTVLFIAIGIGVMLRFRVDPRTVMTLQNQIPRVIIAIILITFSFAIAGAMIDLMWTVTYAGVNFISNSAPNSKIAVDCPKQPKPISQVADTRLLDQPISFTNTVFRADCKGNIDNGLFSLSDKVSASLGDLVTQLVHDLLLNDGNQCHAFFLNLIGDAKCAIQNGALTILVWVAEQLVKLIIIIAILIALFRLWFELIKCYLTFLIFVIMGPIWIVLGLVPGRPLGFEKWLRIIFSNLAVFPLVAFILVFARIIVDAVPSGPTTPNTVFVPPLVGNPSLATFSDLMGFGAIMIAPSIPNLIKERMKAKSQSNLGGTVAAGVGMAATAFSSPGHKAWESLNRRNPTTGAPEGALAIQKAKLARSLPIVGRRVIARDKRRHAAHDAYTSADWGNANLGLRGIRNTIPPRGSGGAAGGGQGTGPSGGGASPASGPSLPRPGFIRNTIARMRGQRPASAGTSAPPGFTNATVSRPGSTTRGTSLIDKLRATQAQQSGETAPTPVANQPKVGPVRGFFYGGRNTPKVPVAERAARAGQAVGNAGRAVKGGVHKAAYGSGQDVPTGYKRKLLGGIKPIKEETPKPKKEGK